MAYIKIFSSGGKQQIGEMRRINGKDVIFNMQGKEVGYSVVVDGKEKIYDISRCAVESVEALINNS